MQCQLVFQEKKEMERLRVQNSLLSCYEAPIFTQIYSEQNAITVLDIGCNDGVKTIERFSSDKVAKVIGLEYNTKLAIKAQKTYGNDKFSFFPFDVEAPDFSKRLHRLMKACGVEGFDVIYLSFVLMHLLNIETLLGALQPFLKENGKLLIIEADDGTSSLSNDSTGLLHEFLAILKSDKYSGNRGVGHIICDLLRDSGYENIKVWYDSISAGVGEKKKKEAIFTTFFSYLPEDVMLLLAAKPDCREYQTWSAWTEKNYDTLRHLIMQDESVISMGIKILTCTKGKNHV